MSRIRTKEDARKRIAELKRELDAFKDFEAQSESRKQQINRWHRHDWPQLPAAVQSELRRQISDLKEQIDDLPEH
jgi:hypothetical protein